VVYSAELLTDFTYTNFTVSYRDASARFPVHLTNVVDICNFVYHPVTCMSFLLLADMQFRLLVCHIAPSVSKLQNIVNIRELELNRLDMILNVKKSCCMRIGQRRITACIDDINKWMSSNRLTLNTDKTQFMWLGTAAQLTKINTRTITLADTDIQVSDMVTCLGVVIDSQLTFAHNVKKLAGSCFYHLRQLRAVRRSLTTDAAKTLVHALISSRVDYCNSVLYGVCEVHLRPLQSVLNAAARLITSKRKFDHIASTVRNDLHWLPVRQRILF